MHALLPSHRPALVLAPMQAVSKLPFLRALTRRGFPDWWVTEYFRVHPHSSLTPALLRPILENQTGRPVFAQLIGSDVASLRRSARQLGGMAVAGIDLNLGCPAPVVCRKRAGGAWLRDGMGLDRLLGSLREAIEGRFTVKTRLGYEEVGEFAGLLELFRRHGIDGLSVHGRTVREGYQTPVHAECIRQAVEAMDCPVMANGNVVDRVTGRALLEATGAAGLMIGRGAIRNPWIFAQLQADFEGRVVPVPVHRDLLDYVMELYEETARETRKFVPEAHVQRMKKTLAYISHGLEGGRFEHEMRRAKTPEDFWGICRRHLDHDAPLPERPPLGSKLFCGFEALISPRAEANG